MSDSLLTHGLYSPWNSRGQNTGVGSLSLLQGIFPTQGSSPGLLYCRQILHQLSHRGSPRILEWVSLFRQEAISPERPHNMPPPLAEALEEAGSTQGGRAPGVFSSLSPRAHRIPPMGSLKRRDQKGHSNASALPLVAGITTEGRGLGCMGHFQ